MSKIFFPQYVRGREGMAVHPGKTVLEHIRMTGGIEIDSECGGNGICGRDVIRVEKGAEFLGEKTEVEKTLLLQGRLKPNQRLACQARVTGEQGDIVAFIPDFGRYTILSDFMKIDVEPNPCAFKQGNRVMYYTGEDLGPYRGRILGLAVDVGTTTLVMQLVDLETGQDVGRPMASKNPQIAYGNDVISRIGYTMNHGSGLMELQQAVVEGINKSLEELEKHLGDDSLSGYIYDVVAVGNSTMRNLFFGLNVHDLGVIPFEAPDKRSITVKARDLGLSVHENARAYAPPLIGGHAGADCLADIISTGIYQREEIGMVIDIGTNGEVVIGNRDKLLTASCAAGGAYEGYQIRCGVGAIQGAITQISIEDGRVKYMTLGNKPPVGVCGSGVIDLLAELFRSGVMNEKARIRKDFPITDTISISQEDINQLIMAKAGLRTDQDLLVKYYGVSMDGVKKIYLAGAFGNYMNIGNAIAIGLLPNIDEKRFVRFGNGALAGALAMLVSRVKRRDAEEVTRIITHTKPNEIEGEQFQYLVADNIYFGS